MKIVNSSALITGGSRGLGRALGRTLANSGARVVLVARGERELNEAVTELRARGAVAHGIALDIADKAAIPALVGQATALVGPIDILVNNASTLGPVPLRLLLDTDCELLERALAVNVVGAFRLTKAVLGSMVLRGQGVVVNVSSDAAHEAYERWGAYGASRAALEQLGRIWSAELAGSGVRLLSVDPGEMNTRMHAEAMPEADPATLADPAEVAQRIADVIATMQP
jgi:NAD(P)-dependent dehydrogenase (short-subunit alcohol dehydrogenase family)